MQELKLIEPNLFAKIDLQIEKYNGENLDFQIDLEENRYLSKLDSIIQENLGNTQFSVKSICEEMAISRSHLYRKISAFTGKSILGYINSYRLTKALDLIKQGEYATIKEIAYKVGYNDNHYFSRSFKQEFGRAPSFYQPKKLKMDEHFLLQKVH